MNRCPRTRDERGATLVIVALSLVALMAIAALAVDGGNLFSSRRSTQNATDAAALAGAEALNTCVTTGCSGAEGMIQDAVTTSLTTNGADSSGYTCELINDRYWRTRAAGDILGACPGAGTAIPALADGVLVTASTTSGASFSRALGTQQLKAGAMAAAQLEKVVLTSGSAPFFACALPDATGGTDPQILLADSRDPTGFVANPAAIGRTYNVWGPHVPLCGGGVDEHGRGGFHGLIGDPTFTLPAWIDDGTGVAAGPTRTALAGSDVCGPNLVDGCHVLLPLCLARQSHGSNTQLWCVRMGEFQLTNVGSNSADGIFLGLSSVLNSGTGGGQPGKNDFRVIRISI